MHPFHELLSKCHILFMHEGRIDSTKQMGRFAKINPYENFGNWWFTILNHEKLILAKINLLKVFETLSIFLSTQNYVILRLFTMKKNR